MSAATEELLANPVATEPGPHDRSSRPALGKLDRANRAHIAAWITPEP